MNPVPPVGLSGLGRARFGTGGQRVASRNGRVIRALESHQHPGQLLRPESAWRARIDPVQLGLAIAALALLLPDRGRSVASPPVWNERLTVRAALSVGLLASTRIRGLRVPVVSAALSASEVARSGSRAARNSRRAGIRRHAVPMLRLSALVMALREERLTDQWERS